MGHTDNTQISSNRPAPSVQNPPASGDRRGEDYHPDKVWTWPKEEQQAYQQRIQPLLDAAAEAEDLFSLDELEEMAELRQQC